MRKKIDSEALLKRATEMLAEEGQLSIKDLRREFGDLPAKTLYQQIHTWQQELGEPGRLDGRHVIKAYIVYRAWRQLLDIFLEEEIKHEYHPRSLLKAFIKQVVDFFGNNLPLATVVIRATPSWEQRSPASYARYNEMFWTRLRLTVRRAQETGCLTEKIDSALLLHLIHGALHQALYGLCISKERKGVDGSYKAHQVVEAMNLLLDRLGDKQESALGLSANIRRETRGREENTDR